MKIIDEKGRLFGRVNVIDFLVVLFFFFLLPAFYFGYKAFSKRMPSAEIEKEGVEIVIPCNLIKVTPEIVKLIKVGDKSFDPKGRAQGEVIWIGEVKPYIYEFFIDRKDSSNTLVVEDKGLKEVPVKLKIKAEIRDASLYYADKHIISGMPFDFKTTEYEVEAVPNIYKDPVKEEKEWMRVSVKFSGVFPELNNMIQQGHMEKDAEGNMIGILNELLKTGYSLVPVLSVKENKFIYISDPYRYDMTATLDLLCTLKKGALYYKNYPVKIGNQITFSSDLYTVSGLITNIKKKDAQ